LKTRKSYALGLFTFSFLAATALYAQYEAGHYAGGGSGSIVQPLPRTKSTDATYDVGSYPLYRPVLEPGDGRQEVYVYCNQCHSPIFITMQPPLSADTWAAEVTKMEKTFGADIPDEVTQKIVHYLQAHYTPETRKH
jgi:hypothetical protein